MSEDWIDYNIYLEYMKFYEEREKELRKHLRNSSGIEEIFKNPQKCKGNLTWKEIKKILNEK